MAHTDVALLLALTLTVVLAYPAKDDEGYYNRLHDFQDSYGKEVRNLDGIDAREEPRPPFNFLSKTSQAEDSAKGPTLKLDYGSSSHLDGIGGGHLVRDLELDQGLAPPVVDVLLPDNAYVGKPESFGVVRKYPVNSRLGSLTGIEGSVKNLLFDPKSAELVISCFINNSCKDDSFFDYLKTLNVENGLPNFKYGTIQDHIHRPTGTFKRGNILNTKKSLDSIGGGHLLYSKKEMGSSEEGNLLSYKNDFGSIGKGYLLNYKKDLDSIGGGHLLNYKKDYLDLIGGGNLLNYMKDLDSIGGGHLLNYKKDLDSIGGGHLLNYKKNYLDSIGREHLLNYKKDLDSIRGGHLLNFKNDYLDSIVGGNLLNYKKDLDSIGGGHLLNYKKDLDSIGGGHLLNYKKDHLDSIGGGHLLNLKKDLESSDGGNPWYLKKYLASHERGPFLVVKKDIDNLLENDIKRGSWPSSLHTTYQKYYSGAGLPIRSSRPLCISSRWFQNILNNYLANEEFKSKYTKVKNSKVLNGEEKEKNLMLKVNAPRWLNVESNSDVINARIKGLSGGLHQTTTDGDQAEPPFRGIIELNKVYTPDSLNQNDR